MLKNKDKIRTALKIVKYLDSLTEKVRKIQTLQSATERELKLLEKAILKFRLRGRILTLRRGKEGVCVIME